MEKQIRQLTLADLPYVKAMETGIADDYVKRLFPRISSGNNRIYGLFLDGQLVSMGGYSLFEDSYAMLGRMRSDQRFRGKDLSTQLMSHVIETVFELPHVQWAGANTQEENLPARRVLEKLGLIQQAALIGAITQDVSMFESGDPCWQEIYQIDRKKQWIEELFIKTSAIFPYECYYPFPASSNLFSDDKLKEWTFFEDESHHRVLITKKDVKKHTYLHTIYPWDDWMQQKGLWETIAAAHRELEETSKEKPYIWMDLDEKKAQALPRSHPFKLPSPWMLYGIDREIKKSVLSDRFQKDIEVPNHFSGK